MPSPPDSGQPIYHMCAMAEWRAAEAEGVYRGSSQDAADGFIHFSTQGQVRASAAKHRAGQTGLVLLTADAGALGEALKWEPARGGDGPRGSGGVPRNPQGPDRDDKTRGAEGPRTSRGPDRETTRGPGGGREAGGVPRNPQGPDRNDKTRGAEGPRTSRGPDRETTRGPGGGREAGGVPRNPQGPDRDEKTTDGALFPHLYGPLALAAVTAVHDLPLGPDGRHLFPPGFPETPPGAPPEIPPETSEGGGE